MSAGDRRDDSGVTAALLQMQKLAEKFGALDQPGERALPGRR